jgi:hypothetical protein
VDLLQSKKINLVTARKLLQEIISGNPESPSEVGESTENINIRRYFDRGGGIIRACVLNAIHRFVRCSCMVMEVPLTVDPMPTTPITED